MPISGTQFKNKELGLPGQYSFGLMNLIEDSGSQGGNFGLRPAGYFSICTGATGGTNTALLADISSTPGTTVLLPSSACPYNMRPYITRCDVDVHGPTSWTGGISVTIQDTNSAPLVYFPVCSLKGLSAYTFPDSDTEIPIVVTATGPAAANGTVTFGATSFVNSAYSNNCIATIIADSANPTFVGQSELIASNGTTSIVPARGSSAWPQGVSSTSVFAIWYWSVTTSSASSPGVASQQGAASPLTANALGQGYNGIIVAGTAVGENRSIQSNTTSAYTVPYNYNTAPAVGDLVHFSNEQNLFGALDLCVGDKWAAAALNTGIQVTVATGMSAGSPLRIYLEGFFAN